MRSDYLREADEATRQHAARMSRAPRAAMLLTRLDGAVPPDERMYKAEFDAFLEARNAALDCLYAVADMSPEEVAAWLRRTGLGQ